MPVHVAKGFPSDGRQSDALRRVGLFAGLDAVERAAVVGLCRIRNYAQGDYLISEDVENRDVIFVIEGRVRVIDHTLSGRMVTFAEIGEGGVVGEIAALDGGGRTAAVKAETDCAVAMISPERFDEVLQRYPCVARALLQRLVRIIRDADQRISELSTLSAASRLCRELLRRARPGAGLEPQVVDPVPTQEQLASLTGATRETVARLLGQLQHSGLVRRVSSRLLILAPERLIEIAELQEQG